MSRGGKQLDSGGFLASKASLSWSRGFYYLFYPYLCLCLANVGCLDFVCFDFFPPLHDCKMTHFIYLSLHIANIKDASGTEANKRLYVAVCVTVQGAGQMLVSLKFVQRCQRLSAPLASVQMVSKI